MIVASNWYNRMTRVIIYNDGLIAAMSPGESCSDVSLQHDQGSSVKWLSGLKYRSERVILKPRVF